MQIKTLTIKNYMNYTDFVYVFGGLNICYTDEKDSEGIFKVLYAACQANKNSVDFAEKLVNVLRPDGYKINRLSGNKSIPTEVSITSENYKGTSATLSMCFDKNTKKWSGVKQGEDNWVEVNKLSESVYIPSFEALSCCYNLVSAIRKDNVHFDETIIDMLCTARVDMNKIDTSDVLISQLVKLQNVMNGIVFYNESKDEYYIQNGQTLRELHLMSKDIRGLACLYVVLQKAGLQAGDVLFIEDLDRLVSVKYFDLVLSILYEMSESEIQVFVGINREREELLDCSIMPKYGIRGMHDKCGSVCVKYIN